MTKPKEAETTSTKGGVIERDKAESFFIEFFRGKHHFPSKMKDWGNGWCINSRQGLATYDFNTLTRLVLMAHEYSIRVELQSAGLHGIKIIIHQRKREGSMYERHPTIEKAIKEFSK